MNRSFKRGFIIGFILFWALPIYLARADGTRLSEGDLVRVDCHRVDAAVPRYLAVDSIESGKDVVRLGRVRDETLGRMVGILEAEAGRRPARDFEEMTVSLRSGRDPQTGCAVKRLSRCEWLARVKEEHVRRRAEILKDVGTDNWKQAFDAEQVDQSATFLMDKYSCPVISPSVPL